MRNALSACAVTVLFAAVGGGGESPSSFGAPAVDPGGDPLLATDSGSSLFADGGAGADSGLGNECAKSSVKPAAIPVQLVFIFDRSESMAGTKWTACSQGLAAFFAAPAGAGVSASLQFFPGVSNACAPATYAAPVVTMRALPNQSDFQTAIKSAQLVFGTPTLPALTGSLQYAQTQIPSNPGGTTAIVLVTDGDPVGCGSTLASVTNAAAASKAAAVPVFVVGIGNTGNLNAIAKAGGTGQATLVSASSPAQTQADFLKALENIRGQTLACEYKIPALPQGTSLHQVNVTYTTGGGVANTLTYDATCSGSVPGWHYDDVKNPTKIVLCKLTCDAVQQDPKGTVDVVFGCDTKGGIPN